MILAATGHRPDKLGGYSPGAVNRLRLIAHKYLVKTRPVIVISGMALGWDQSVAQAALLAGVPFVAAIPFVGQERKWPAASQEAYHEVLAQAEKVHIVCAGGYEPWKMQQRNEWMVDKCDRLVAMWNGGPGGTANCLAYNEATKRVPVDNLWPEFVK